MTICDTRANRMERVVVAFVAPETMFFRPQNYALYKDVYRLESTQCGEIPFQINHLGVLSTTYSPGGAGTPGTMTVQSGEAPGTMSFSPQHYDL